MSGPRTPEGDTGAGTSSTTDAHRHHTDIPGQLRRRRAASWRCEPIADSRRDPADPMHLDGWTDDEISSWIAAVAHLRAEGLYGGWQVPGSVQVAWYRHRACQCGGRGDAA